MAPYLIIFMHMGGLGRVEGRQWGLLRKETASELGVDIEKLDEELDRLEDGAGEYMKDMRNVFVKWSQRKYGSIDFSDLYFAVSYHEDANGLRFDALNERPSVQSYLKAYERKDPAGLAKLLPLAYEASKMQDVVRKVEYETSLRWKMRKSEA